MLLCYAREMHKQKIEREKNETEKKLGLAGIRKILLAVCLFVHHAARPTRPHKQLKGDRKSVTRCGFGPNVFDVITSELFYNIN